MRSRGLTIALTVVASAIMFATMPQFVRAQVTYIEFSKLAPTQATYDINAPQPASELLARFSTDIASSINTDIRLATTRLKEMFTQYSYNTLRLVNISARYGFDYFAESLNKKHKQTMKLVFVQNRFASKQVNSTADVLANAGLNAKENSAEVLAQIKGNVQLFVDGSVNGIKKSSTVIVRLANNAANYALDGLTNVVDLQTQRIVFAVETATALKQETLWGSSGATLVRTNLVAHPLVVDLIPKFELDSSQLAIADSFKSGLNQTFDFTDYRSLNQMEQSTTLIKYIAQNLIRAPEGLLAIYESKIYSHPTIPSVEPNEIYVALSEMYLGSTAQGLMESKIEQSPKFAFTLPGENFDTLKLVNRTDSVLAISTNLLKKFVLNDFNEVYTRVVNAFIPTEQTQQFVDAKLERVGQLADYIIVPVKLTASLALNISTPVQFSSNGSFFFDEMSKTQQVAYREVTPRVLGESTTGWWQKLFSKFTGTSQTAIVIYHDINVSAVETPRKGSLVEESSPQ